MKSRAKFKVVIFGRELGPAKLGCLGARSRKEPPVTPSQLFSSTIKVKHNVHSSDVINDQKNSPSSSDYLPIPELLSSNSSINLLSHVQPFPSSQPLVQTTADIPYNTTSPPH